MLRYIISYQNDNTVILENATEENGIKNTVQLTNDEFCIMMQYPTLSKKEIAEKMWNVCDKSQGKLALQKIVDTAFGIMGRD